MSSRVLLMDNGSLEPESTFQLRRLASELSDRLECRVDPVSVAHSAKIPANDLNGRPAELFEGALERGWREGVNEFVVLPLFIGPSHAVTRHVPAVVAERAKNWKGFRAKIAAPLFAGADTRLARIVADHVREVFTEGGDARVAIVDHGSPNPEVTQVRDIITDQVRELLGARVVEVQACSMERREGSEYDFNEPLLERLFAQPGWSDQPVIAGMLFIAPGRHAGPNGDVAKICSAARSNSSPVKISRLLGQHPLLLEVLADRAREG
ncbi:MAG: CbiX/SirB N-terminal domain-containing protein [Opitutus sp.]